MERKIGVLGSSSWSKRIRNDSIIQNNINICARIKIAGLVKELKMYDQFR